MNCGWNCYDGKRASLLAPIGGRRLSLAWNTRQLLGAGDDSPTRERIAIEYHLLKGRELYDAKIISADRYSSGAAEWVLKGTPNFYSVSVMTRPFYSLPQELCLSFDCFSKTTKGRNTISIGPPIDEVALEFAALLSLLAREPVGLLGSRRIGNRPIISQNLYAPPPRESRKPPSPAGPIDSTELTAIIKGLGQSTNQQTIDAALAATKLYYAGLSFARFDPSVAYVLLAAAIECLAGYHYGKHIFAFDDVPKFDNLRLTLDKLSALAGGNTLVEQLKKELIQSEHFLIRKFCLLVADFLPDEFWTSPDDLYQTPSVGAPDSKPALSKSLKAVYSARSKYVHEGAPFPAHIEFGLHERIPAHVAMAGIDIGIDISGNGTKKTVPAYIWFERVAHLVIKEYLRRSFAPEIVTAREQNAEEKARVQEVIRNLANNIRESLRKLTFWTRPFLGMATINPFAPNKEWADEQATVVALRDADLIGTTDPTITGASWLKNREVGEAVGEFFFGAAANPFRGNELLLPKGWEQIFTEIDKSDPPPATS